jgi:hypothetical protein
MAAAEMTLITTDKKVASSDPVEPVTTTDEKPKHSINRITCELKITKTW